MEREFRFEVSQAVLDLGLQGAYLRISGLRNREGDPDFEDLRESVLRVALGSLSDGSILADKQLVGFRALHDSVKRSNRKNVASPENLLRLLLERKTMPRINLLVDIYNLVSIETRLALGAHDVAFIEGNVSLRMTTGSEAFWPLGINENKGVSAGEYAYIDDANEVLCRLEVRQVEKTKVRIETTDCFYIIQGSAATAKEEVKHAVQRLVELTQRFCGGEAEVLYTTAP